MSPALYVSCATVCFERGGGGGYMHFHTSRRPIRLCHNLVFGISISDFKICCLEWIAKYNNYVFWKHRKLCGVYYMKYTPPPFIRRKSSPDESLGPRLGCMALPFAFFWNIWFFFYYSWIQIPGVYIAMGWCAPRGKWCHFGRLFIYNVTHNHNFQTLAKIYIPISES